MSFRASRSLALASVVVVWMCACGSGAATQSGSGASAGGPGCAPDAASGRGTKAHDIPDAETVDDLGQAMQGRFAFAWASVKKRNALFHSAYHIKVALMRRHATTAAKYRAASGLP